MGMPMKSIKLKSTLTFAIGVTCALALFACAPSVSVDPADQNGETVGGDVPAAQVEWSIDSDCAACHTEEAASMEDATLLASGHAAFDCVTCHAEADIASSHQGVTAPPDEDQQLAIKKAGRTMGTIDFCLQCHGTLEELAEKTTDVTLVKDSNGTVVNPHAIPENAAHEEDGVQQCYNCHRLHNTSPSPTTNCNTCHHQGVFECGTCHAVEN